MPCLPGRHPLYLHFLLAIPEAQQHSEDFVPRWETAAVLANVAVHRHDELALFRPFGARNWDIGTIFPGIPPWTSVESPLRGGTGYVTASGLRVRVTASGLHVSL